MSVLKASIYYGLKRCDIWSSKCLIINILLQNGQQYHSARKSIHIMLRQNILPWSEKDIIIIQKLVCWSLVCNIHFPRKKIKILNFRYRVLSSLKGVLKHVYSFNISWLITLIHSQEQYNHIMLNMQMVHKMLRYM